MDLARRRVKRDGKDTMGAFGSSQPLPFVIVLLTAHGYLVERVRAKENFPATVQARATQMAGT